MYSVGVPYRTSDHFQQLMLTIFYTNWAPNTHSVGDGKFDSIVICLHVTSDMCV